MATKGHAGILQQGAVGICKQPPGAGGGAAGDGGEGAAGAGVGTRRVSLGGTGLGHLEDETARARAVPGQL